MSLLENYHDQDIKGPTVIQVTTVIYDIQTQSILPFIADFCNHDITIRELKILCLAHIFFSFLKKNVSLPCWWPGRRTALSPRLGPLPCPWVGNYPGWPVILAQHERVYREYELLSFCHIAIVFCNALQNTISISLGVLQHFSFSFSVSHKVCVCVCYPDLGCLSLE